MKHKQTLRRGLSVLLALAMCLSLLPATALAAETATATADFTADGDATAALELLNAAKTTGAEDSTWDSATSTLTLNGVNFSTSAATAVKLPENAKIVLAEGTTNTIASAAENAEMSYGIYATNGLTIEGSGTLTVTGGEAKYSYGICAAAYEDGDGNSAGGSITISGGTVTATGGEASSDSYGIYAADYKDGDGSVGGSITISGGTVIAASGTADRISYGISANNGDITISDGAVAATGGISSYVNSGGIGGHSVQISGGTVTAKGGQAGGQESGGSYGISASYLVQISGGVVTATGSTAGYSSYGIYGPYVTITGGVVTATGGGGGTYSCGISKSTTNGIPIAISGGHVIARTQASSGTHRALGVAPDLSKYTGYYWRTSSDDAFTNGTYEYSNTHTYVEFNDSGSTVTTYTVTVQNDGNGSATATSETAAAGTEITLSATANSGYHFKEWQVISGTVAITDNKFTMPESNVTVKAIFEADAPSTTTYTVHFNANGGSGSMPDATGVSGSYTLPTCGFTAPSGKQFKAWSVDGTEYAAGASITVSADTIVTALWEDIFTVTVTTDGHGNATASSTTAAAGTEITLTATANSGYHFKEWQVTSGGVTITGNKFTMPSANVTVNAIFEMDKYTVTFDGNGGTVEQTTMTTGDGWKLTGNLPTPTRDGYTFDGWYTEGGTAAVTTETVFDQNTTLYAHWTINQYTITFVTNGGTTIDPITLDYGATVIAPENPTKTGYTFAGWDTDIPSTMPAKDMTITAKWTKNSSGSSTPTYTPSVTQPENGTVTVSPKAPKKGDTVTITPKPEDGYTVEQILVTDKDGNPVKVTNNGDGTYSFTQPEGKVTVEVTFMEDNSMLNFFVDVPANAYYYDAVLWAAENGITGGVDDTHFAPDAPCTRAQIVTFLWRAAGCPEPENVSSFADVSADSYYAKAVAWAVENGITGGTGDGMFSPNATCTRAQAMTFIWRSQKSAAPDGANPFTDVAADAYYADAVLWAVANGITDGTSDTTFSPNANCTRAQIVTFLYRCLGEE